MFLQFFTVLREIAQKSYSYIMHRKIETILQNKIKNKSTQYHSSMQETYLIFIIIVITKVIQQQHTFQACVLSCPSFVCLCVSVIRENVCRQGNVLDALGKNCVMFDGQVGGSDQFSLEATCRYMQSLIVNDYQLLIYPIFEE